MTTAPFTRAMAIAGLKELQDFDHPELPVCELPEEAMERAWNAIIKKRREERKLLKKNERAP
jgi:hypothetical protein